MIESVGITDGLQRIGLVEERIFTLFVGNHVKHLVVVDVVHVVILLGYWLLHYCVSHHFAINLGVAHVHHLQVVDGDEVLALGLGFLVVLLLNLDLLFYHHLDLGRGFGGLGLGGLLGLCRLEADVVQCVSHSCASGCRGKHCASDGC